MGWGLLQGMVLPGLADLFFLPLAVARPARAYRLALVSSAGTIIGSVVLYFLGAQALPWLTASVSGVFDLSPEKFDGIRATLA